MFNRRHTHVRPTRTPLVGRNVGIAAFLLVGLPCIAWITGLAPAPSATFSDEPASLPPIADFEELQAMFAAREAGIAAVGNGTPQGPAGFNVGRPL